MANDRLRELLREQREADDGRTLGHPELSVPRIALGCGNFGGVGSAPEFFGRGLTEDQAFELMNAAWESGLEWFDTADAYGGGRSEQAIGRWIASRGVRPRLTTKTFNPLAAGADHGLKPDRIVRQLRSSLERLGVDHVELYLAHDYDPDVPLAEALGAFQAAQNDGLIGGYGVSCSRLKARAPRAWSPRVPGTWPRESRGWRGPWASRPRSPSRTMRPRPAGLWVTPRARGLGVGARRGALRQAPRASGRPPARCCSG